MSACPVISLQWPTCAPHCWLHDASKFWHCGFSPCHLMPFGEKDRLFLTLDRHISMRWVLMGRLWHRWSSRCPDSNGFSHVFPTWDMLSQHGASFFGTHSCGSAIPVAPSRRPKRLLLSHHFCPRSGKNKRSLGKMSQPTSASSKSQKKTPREKCLSGLALVLPWFSFFAILVGLIAAVQSRCWLCSVTFAHLLDDAVHLSCC